MEGLIEAIIKQRMTGLGFQDYEIKMKSVELNSAGDVCVQAQNEYLYLVDVDDDTDAFNIQADNTIMDSSEFLFASIPFVISDFTGNVIISKSIHTATQNLLFVRVIPKK
ncbi:hypothetical protein SDC9_53746 [bioreactor metagenome]|uniref:Uncharacterized protein n=1 Tax=bioreactor metagenome TaxID=1076179 RepID=A0A644WU80_9ZZZZ